ncbi:hypothetical protein ACIRBX_06285 [Kitasatospora sp. NPDC096147]|uniref:hypothetical protein n=1 Tax=Kitasatospora sp. NPDC096147 TaxID=3364093 RepID=UPI003819C759
MREDLRRSALAFGVAALDTYLHWEIRKVAFTTPLPKKLAELSVNFGDLLAMGDASVEARNNQVKDRPRTRARNVLNEQLLTMTFQSARQVESALAMLGVQKPWSKLSAVITPSASVQDLQSRLNALSHRRNKIVHEGDLMREARPQKIKREVVTPQTVAEDLDWIESFIAALATVLT